MGAVAEAWATLRLAGAIDETFIGCSYLTPPHIYPAQVGDRVFPATTPDLASYIQAQERS